MTTDNLCNSCTNIGCEFQSGIVRTKCAFYMPPHIEPDNCGNYAVMQPTAEAIPKDQYEARLKADIVDILDKIRADIHYNAEMHEDGDWYLRVEWVDEILDKYKAESEE